MKRSGLLLGMTMPLMALAGASPQAHVRDEPEDDLDPEQRAARRKADAQHAAFVASEATRREQIARDEEARIQMLATERFAAAAAKRERKRQANLAVAAAEQERALNALRDGGAKRPADVAAALNVPVRRAEELVAVLADQGKVSVTKAGGVKLKKSKTSSSIAPGAGA